MGAYRRVNAAAVAADMQRVYELFPTLKERRRQLAGSLFRRRAADVRHRARLDGRARASHDRRNELGPCSSHRRSFIETLVQIRKEGVTVLLVEQDVFSAFYVADRGYVMETGAIVRVGRAAELAEDPEVKRAYLGI